MEGTKNWSKNNINKGRINWLNKNAVKGLYIELVPQTGLPVGFFLRKFLEKNRLDTLVGALCCVGRGFGCAGRAGLGWAFGSSGRAGLGWASGLALVGALGLSMD